MSKYTEAFLAAAATEMGLGNPPAGYTHSACYSGYARHEAGEDSLSPTDPRLAHGQRVYAGVVALQAKYDAAQLAAWDVFVEKQRAAGRLPDPAVAPAPEAYNLASHTETEAKKVFLAEFNAARLLNFHTTGNPYQFIGWRTDNANRAGTAHLYVDTSPTFKGLSARSVCGREILMANLQAESASLPRCKRCARSISAEPVERRVEMLPKTGFFVDEDGKTRRIEAPGAGLRCELEQCDGYIGVNVIGSDDFVQQQAVYFATEADLRAAGVEIVFA